MNRIAFYGTLRRGEMNHHVVSDIDGTWQSGTVRGWAYDLTWGSAQGFPGLTLDPAGSAVPVDVLEADDLDRHLGRLDRFEGDAYERVVATVELGSGETTKAWVYEAVTDD